MKYLPRMLDATIKTRDPLLILYTWQYMTESEQPDKLVTSISNGKQYTRNVRFYLRFLFEHRTIRNATAHYPDESLRWLNLCRLEGDVMLQDDSRRTSYDMGDILYQMLFYALEFDTPLFDKMVDWCKVVGNWWYEKEKDEMFSAETLTDMLIEISKARNFWREVKSLNVIDKLWQNKRCKKSLFCRCLNKGNAKDIVTGLVKYKAYIWRRECDAKE